MSETSVRMSIPRDPSDGTRYTWSQIDMTQTKTAIQRAFLRLYTKKPLERISVSELCRCTPVARTTFYTYYGRLEDVREDIENTVLGQLRCLADTFDTQPASKLLQVFRSIRQHWDVNYAFLVARPNSQYITRWKDMIRDHLIRRTHINTAKPQYAAVTEFAVSALVGTYTHWLEHPEDLSAADLSAICTQALHQLKPLL